MAARWAKVTELLLALFAALLLALFSALLLALVAARWAKVRARELRLGLEAGGLETRRR